MWELTGNVNRRIDAWKEDNNFVTCKRLAWGVIIPRSCSDMILVEAVFLALTLHCCEALVGNFHCTAKGGGMGTVESNDDILYTSFCLFYRCTIIVRRFSSR